jgi:hypothetical protein
MPSSRLRRLIAMNGAWWCLAGIMLMAMQPFIAAHFCQHGLEDEAELQVRIGTEASRIEADEPGEQETTVFVAPSASIDLPDALQHAIDAFLALLLLAVALTVARPRLAMRVERPTPGKVPYLAGAPPPSAAPWLSRPPQAAPPSTT